MTNQDQPQDFDRLQSLGILLIVITSGFPAMELGGFGFGVGLDFETYLVISAIGGAIGGALMGSSCRWAGAIGGAVAGPSGLLVLSWYLAGRQKVWSVELVLVQMVASLPGVAVYYVLRALAPRREPLEEEERFDDDADQEMGR